MEYRGSLSAVKTGEQAGAIGGRHLSDSLALAGEARSTRYARAGITVSSLPTSLTVGGRETLDGPLEIKTPIDDMTVVFTDRPSEITGTLQDATGRPATDYFIVVFSTNRAYWTPLSRRVLHANAAADTDTGVLHRKVTRRRLGLR